MLEQLDREELALVVPLVHRRRAHPAPRSTAGGSAARRAPPRAPWRPRSCPRPRRLPAAAGGRGRSSAASPRRGRARRRSPRRAGSRGAPRSRPCAPGAPLMPASSRRGRAASVLKTAQASARPSSCGAASACTRRGARGARDTASRFPGLAIRRGRRRRRDARGEVPRELLEHLVGHAVHQAPAERRGLAAHRRLAHALEAARAGAVGLDARGEVHRAADDPVVSVPLAMRCSDRVAASSPATSISPRKESVAGPTLTVTVPL